MSGYAQAGEMRQAGAIEDLVKRGIAFATGRGAQVNFIEAHKCFNLAAASGDRRAAARREEIAGEMSRDEIAEALRAARAWMAKH